MPFITKYFEYQHQLDTSTATLITGAIALLSVIIGCPVGALLINKFNWTTIKCARICTIVLTISSFLFLFLTLSCPELKFQNTYCTKQNGDCCRNKYHPGMYYSNVSELFYVRFYSTTSFSFSVSSRSTQLDVSFPMPSWMHQQSQLNQ